EPASPIRHKDPARRSCSAAGGALRGRFLSPIRGRQEVSRTIGRQIGPRPLCANRAPNPTPGHRRLDVGPRTRKLGSPVAGSLRTRPPAPAPAFLLPQSARAKRLRRARLFAARSG